MKKQTRKMLCGAALVAGYFPCHAQPDSGIERLESDEAKISISAGALYGTASLTGGSSLRPKWSPLFDLSYEHGRFFASTERGIGYNLVQNKVWTVGAGLAYLPKRKASSNVRLRGMGDVDASPTVLLSANWRLMDDFINVYGALASATKRSNGSFLTIGAIVGFPIHGKLSGFVDLSSVIANRNYAQTYYGVTTVQAVNSGYAQFQPKAGLISTSASVGLNYELTKEWSLGATLGTTRLQSDAASSPLITKRTEPSASLFATYAF